MLKKRRSQGTFTVIVAAVIGLIIIVVVILLLTDKIGGFSKGMEETSTCVNACKALGKAGANNAACPTTSVKFPGNFKEGSACCCT